MLMYRSPLAALPVAGIVAVMTRSRIATEEVALQQNFGAEFTEYCGTVPRWFFDRRTIRRSREADLLGQRLS